MGRLVLHPSAAFDRLLQQTGGGLLCKAIKKPGALAFWGKLCYH